MVVGDNHIKSPRIEDVLSVLGVPRSLSLISFGPGARVTTEGWTNCGWQPRVVARGPGWTIFLVPVRGVLEGRPAQAFGHPFKIRISVVANCRAKGLASPCPYFSWPLKSALHGAFLPWGGSSKSRPDTTLTDDRRNWRARQVGRLCLLHASFSRDVCHP